MKYFLITFSDYTETRGTARTKKDMERDARAYCRAWNLSETVRDVSEISSDEYNARKQ